jgi:hypothetical protein
MRKIIATIFTMLCLMAFIGCQQRKPGKLELFDVGMENTSLDSYQTETVFRTEVIPKVTAPESTEGTKDTFATLDSMTETTVGTEATEMTQASHVSKDETPTKPKADEVKPTPTQSRPAPTVPKVTQPETEPTVPTTVPPENEPAKPEPTQPEAESAKPEPTQPETKPTVPETKPTEPTGCAHNWKAIHHKEKGHWKAGIVCDCGWTVYGNANELVSKWNAHSASYPAEVAFFEHGGYGSADKWIVDEPAYDEWVCRLCGEPKP